MKLKSAVRFYLDDFKKPVIIFYGVLLVLFALEVILMNLLNETGSTSGMGSATSIFMFVIGLNAFKTQFRLFLQNGLSRKTMFSGFILGIALLSAAMTLIDLAFGRFQGLFLTYESVYMSRFGSLYTNSSADLMDELLWTFLSYLTAGLTGYAITCLYYRMNKGLKLAVSIGIPALVIIVIPLIDGLYTNGVITAFFLNIVAFALGYGITLDASNGLLEGVISQFFGLQNGVPLYPYRAILFSVISITLTGAFSFLCIRRATIKD